MDSNTTPDPFKLALARRSGTQLAHHPVLLTEFLLTVVAGLLLFWLAHPLVRSDAIGGLGDRYVAAGALDLQAQRAMALARDLPCLLLMMALAGWAALRLGRSNLTRLTVIAGQAALWLSVWRTTLDSGVDARALAGWASFGLITFAVALSIRRRPSAKTFGEPVHALAFPGWVLFTGLGLIWLIDFSARGYPKLRFLGLAHADALVAAYAIVTICAGMSRQLTALLARLCAAVDRAIWLGPQQGLRRFALLLLPLLFTVWCVAVAATFGHSRPALTSELLRLPFIVVAAWSLHRWAEQGQRRRALVFGALAALAITAGLAGTGDFGQILLIGLGLAIALGAAITAILGGSRMAALAGVGAALLVILGSLQIVHNYGHLVARHIGWRVEALDHPFGGRLEYLSELRWFAASTPVGGHGLTHVPWCGTVASLDLTAARCNGVPVQIASDYVFLGLAGVWGLWAAAGVTVLLATWLVSLVRMRPGVAEDPDRLRSWLVACFVAVILAQLMFTTLGGLGLVLLTGVTFPLVGFGSASLTVCAVFVGLALRR